MGAQDLEQPLLDGGVRSVNFFNGRLLTAHDLRREQDARHIGDRRLGQAIGAGVAYGLEVSKDGASTVQEPLVTVNAGLAVNREGQTLYLKSQISIALVRKATPGAAKDGDFGPCGVLNTGTYVAGPGVYLLTIAPARADEGRALTSGFDQYGGKCNTDAVVETVQFRLVSIDVSQLQLALPEADVRKESLFRNQLAMICLGSTAQGDPFAVRAGDPAVLLAGRALSRCDVPLGIIYWTLGDGIRFVDQWAVRRRLSGPDDRRTVLFPQAAAHALGEAWLLQFASQVDELLVPGVATDPYRIEEFFRYLPPAAYFPVKGAGSLAGLHATNFVGSFARGAPDTLMRDRATLLLEESFGFAPVDLSLNPLLQVFEIEENLQAISDGKATQQFLLFASRSLHGPGTHDCVTAAFEGAWTVYRGLSQRRVFLPPGSTPEETAARFDISGGVRDIMEVASREAARAAGSDLDEAAALEAFGILYDAQDDLMQYMKADIPGVPDTQERKRFAITVDQYLNQSIPGTKPALKSAVDAGSLAEAVDAQDEINRFVGSWSGEGVAIGPFGFAFGHSDGTSLVPGAAALAQFFTVSNGTDRNLTMRLTAVANAATGTWGSGNARIRGSVAGSEIDRVTLASGASREIVVMVSAPSDADASATAAQRQVTLTLTADVGPPTSRQSIYPNATLLQVAATTTGPVAGVVAIGQAYFVPATLDPADIDPVTDPLFGLRVPVTYAASDGIAQDFELNLHVDSGDATLWAFMDEDTTAPLPGSGADHTLLLSQIRADEQPVEARILIQPPPRDATLDRSVAFTLSVRSLNLANAVTDTSSSPITLVVHHS